MNKKTLHMAHGALIAAMYAALTFVSHLVGLSNGVIQVRLSEALTVLPLFTPAAVPGLFVGCMLANILTGCAIWDVVLGSLATLLGALGTYCIGRKCVPLSPVFPVISNAVIVPFVLQFVYGASETWFYLFVTVGIGEVISCGVLGMLLYRTIKKTNIFKD